MQAIPNTARFAGRLAGAALLLAIAGCSSGLGPSEAQLVDAERKWLAAAVADYSMVVTRGTPQGPPIAVQVTVAQGVVTDRRFAGTSDPVPAADAAAYPNVEGLFALVRDAFDRAASVSVSFNATYGFPESVVADFFRNRFDDDVTVAVTQFAPAP
jgi:hypothetical protein